MRTRKTKEIKQTEPAILEPKSVVIDTDVFSLSINVCPTQLFFQLKDYVSWNIYKKYFYLTTQPETFSSLSQFYDIYSLFEIYKKDTEKNKLIKYKFGEIIKINNLGQFIVNQQGKIKIIKQVGKKQKIYKINLNKNSQIKKRDRLKIINQLTQKQLYEDFQNQIIQLKKQNIKLQKELNLVRYQLFMSEYMQERQVKKQLQKDYLFQIFCKDLTGHTSTLDVKMSNTIQRVKELIKLCRGIPEDQQRIIFAGMQLEDNFTIQHYQIRPLSTLHCILRLKGSIGIFNEYIESQYRDLLLNKGNQLTDNQVMKLINVIKGNPLAKFDLKNVCINQPGLISLINYCNQRYNDKLIQQKLQIIEDFKLNLTISQICSFIGDDTFRQLQKIFNSDYNQIVIRRCQAYGKLIKFHTDAQQKTLQLCLNDDSQYVGGRLIFVNNQGIHTPKRTTGTVTIHDNTIVHAVSLLQSGIRMSLFLLKH